MADRDYHCKDVELLMACETICQSAQDDLAFLVTKRANWADPFFPNLRTRIDDAFQEHLGIDNAQALRQSTAALIAIFNPAEKDLAEFKVQIDADFKNNPLQNEILTSLGFTAHLKDVQNGDQEALIELLNKFKENIPTYQAQILAKGMNVALINTIVGYADTLKNANVTQESAKGTRKTITDTAIIEFNGIYGEVINVCKISFNFYKDNKPQQDKFSFSKVVRNMNTPPPGDGNNPPPPPPP